MSREQKEEAVRRYVQCLNDKDVSVIEKLYAPDAVVEDPVGSEPVVGIRAIVEFYQKSGFPPLRKAELTGPVRCAKNAAAFPFRVTFEGEGGRGVQTLDIIDTFEFDETSRVISMKAYWG